VKTVATYQRIEREREEFPIDHARLVEFINRHALDHVRRYHDNVDAGERRGLASLLRDAQLGHFEVVLALRADVVHRNPRELEQFIEQLDGYGVDVAFVQKYTRTENALHRPGRRPREFDVDYARRLRGRGTSIAAIAKKLGVGYATVHRALSSTAGRTAYVDVAQLELGLMH
jgi:DNA invertase Pin-like site-specific DNA recombinase